MKQISDEIRVLKNFYPAGGVESFVRFINETVQLQEKYQFSPQIFVWGHGGVGKTTIIRRFLGENGYVFEDIKLSQVSPVSVAGLFYPEPEIKQTIRFLSSRLRRIYDSLKQGKKAALFLDELLRAHPDVISAVWELVLERVLDGYDFNGLLVICASNPDMRKVAQIGQPFFSRFRHFVLEPEPKEVANYIFNKTGCRHVSSLIMARPDLLIVEDEFYKASPRQWEFLAAACENRISLEGFVSDDVLFVFKNVREITDKMRPIEEYIQNPGLLERPDDFDSAVIVWNLIFYLFTKLDSKNLEKFKKIIQKIGSFGDDYTVTMFATVRDALVKSGVPLGKAIDIGTSILPRMNEL